LQTSAALISLLVGKFLALVSILFMSEEHNMRLGIAVLICLASLSYAVAFTGIPIGVTFASQKSRTEDSTKVTHLEAKKAGSFFNEVPENSEEEKNDEKDSIDSEASELIQQRKKPSLASQPSTINGKPTSGIGFGKKVDPSSPSASGNDSSKPFIGIGPPVNDPTKPEYDDQGYTLYTSEKTGEKSRVFEALVDYPTTFTMKIVGANEGAFVEEMLQIVAESCEKDNGLQDIPYSTKTMGKWISVTVEAPVNSAEMLYVCSHG
jgi:putative lipoic acid-binding regulatory protein